MPNTRLARASTWKNTIFPVTNTTCGKGSIVRKTNNHQNPKTGTVDSTESFLTVEVRTAAGTIMRIQGSMTAAHLHEIITAG